jgi:hypothetical protein
LGTTVTCDSGGFPTSDGNSKVEIYTGSTPYKLTLKNSAGTTIWTLDNIKAALDTSTFLTDSDIAPDFPVTNSSSNQALVAADQGKFYNLDCSGGDITVTLAASSALGNGWNVEIRHDGTANQILIIGTGSELFKIAGRAGVVAFAIGHRGQSVSIKCDGTGFHVQESSPDLLDTNGVILIADRLSAPPSAEAGARYLVGSAPTGAWSTFAQYDIAEANGQGGWFAITPPTDCGWMAYVQDEDAYYCFVASAWVEMSATQTEMEADSSVARWVTPGRIKYAQGVAKAHGKADVSGAVVGTAYGVSSVTDGGAGRITYTWTTAFSSANYTVVACTLHSTHRTIVLETQAAGTVALLVSDAAAPSTGDPTNYYATAHGDL